jgi:hypothetical protein
MKKLFLSLFVLTSSVAFCQTTDEEYNYITKGYAAQVAAGLDMKQGYSFADKGTTDLNVGYAMSVDIKYLYRTNGNVYAGALLMIHNGKKDNTMYFCVPAPGSPMPLWNKSLSDIQAAYANDKGGDKGAGEYEAIMYALMHVLPN